MSGEKFKHIETTALQQVPKEERKSWIDVALIQAGIMICVPSLMLGGILAESMPMSKAILSGLVGYFITIILFSLMGMVGSDLGVPTCVVAFAGFGKHGSRFIISGLLMISMIGWFAVQASVCGSAFTNLVSEFFGIDIPVFFSMILWGVIMLVTAVYGFNALNQLNRFAVPALVLVTIGGCILALRQYGTDNLYADIGIPTMTFVDGIVLTVSFMAAGALTAPDITRYQKTRRDTVLSSSIGVMPAGMAMLVMGAVMTRIAAEYDISLVFCEIGIPVIGLLVLIMAAWTTNTTNAYCAGLDAVLVFNLADNKRAKATMIMGLLGTALAVAGIANYFENFLYILGDAFMPMMGVFLSQHWIIAKGSPEKYQIASGWNWIGLVSWAAGVLVTVCIPVGIPFVQGMIAAFILYTVLSKLLGEKGPASQQGAG